MCSEYTKPKQIALNRSLSYEPLESDAFRPATTPQVNYLERLCEILQYSEPTRNAQIGKILKRNFPGDLWSLSRSEASQVIDQFKKWKEERNG